MARYIKTWLPLFGGFYGSEFEPDDEKALDFLNEERKEKNLKEVEFDKCKFKYKEWREEVAKLLCTKVEESLKQLFPDVELGITFENIWSPKFYNFENDVINVKVSFNKDFLHCLKEYIENNQDKVSNYLKEQYTSRDGFVSFYNNSLDEWLTIYWKQIGQNEHLLGAFLEAVLVSEGVELTLEELPEVEIESYEDTE